jgi:hypothetical protein
MLAWVFFRAPSVSDARVILERIVLHLPSLPGSTLHPGLDGVQFTIALALIAALFAAEIAGVRKPVRARLAARPRLQRWSAYYAFAVVFVVLVLWSPDRTPQPFIYFQF